MALIRRMFVGLCAEQKASIRIEISRSTATVDAPGNVAHQGRAIVPTGPTVPLGVMEN